MINQPMEQPVEQPEDQETPHLQDQDHPLIMVIMATEAILD